MLKKKNRNVDVLVGEKNPDTLSFIIFQKCNLIDSV